MEYAELGRKENLKMACKDDRIWTKSLLFIYAKICVNVKCHLDHALFMVWLFLWGKKGKGKKKHVGLTFSSNGTSWLEVWQARSAEQAAAQARPGVGTLPNSAGLFWSGQVWKGTVCPWVQLEIIACASPWIEGCAICKIPKDNLIYSCCKQCLYKVY